MAIGKEKEEPAKKKKRRRGPLLLGAAAAAAAAGALSISQIGKKQEVDDATSNTRAKIIRSLDKSGKESTGKIEQQNHISNDNSLPNNQPEIQGMPIEMKEKKSELTKPDLSDLLDQARKGNHLAAEELFVAMVDIERKLRSTLSMPISGKLLTEEEIELAGEFAAELEKLSLSKDEWKSLNNAHKIRARIAQMEARNSELMESDEKGLNDREINIIYEEIYRFEMQILNYLYAQSYNANPYDALFFHMLGMNEQQLKNLVITLISHIRYGIEHEIAFDSLIRWAGLTLSRTDPMQDNLYDVISRVEQYYVIRAR